jgi:lipoprotein-anchoring transpeptidase ErfK/SrfK
MRTLSRGMVGSDVARLTARLSTLGYAVARSRTYTQSTLDAVMAFQKLNGLERDGVCGARTSAALATPRGARVGAGAGDRIVVDLSDQVLLVVRDGRIRRIVNASTGRPDLPDGRGEATPTGTFRVQRKVAGTDVGELGPMYWPSYFHGGIAVHGSPSVPGSPASHGCVRIPMQLARSVFDAMHAGMLVQVRA